ncbi:MAG: nucleotide exchange factor GrpE [Deltaproteobacteria bacterium]|nr:nucleotide exchange factor GrpE [Deltaproteobacteria bacterium]
MSDSDENTATPSSRDDGGIAVEVDASDVRTPPDSPAARTASLEGQLAAAEKDKKDNWDKYLRAVADLENQRKRARRDIDDAKAEAKTKVLKEMLPVVDNLERALAHSTPEATAVMEGVRLVLRQFLTALERCEVTPVEAIGHSFDPNLHEAIGQEEADAAPGTIVKVLQTGYRLSDRLLRPALVVIARPRATPADASA